MRLCYAILLCLFASAGFSQVEGRIFDKETKDAMPYVKVSCGKKKAYSDINGFFQLDQETCDSLKIQYVGYKDLTVPRTGKFQNIFIESETANFDDLIISSDHNPAIRIMKAVIKRRKDNDPLKHSFQYHAYNKFFMTIAMDSSFLMEYQNDSVTINLYETLQSQYLFFTESVINRHRENARNDIEFVLYERTSGFENHALAIAASELQSFSIYDAHIQIGGVQFLNPISKMGLASYEYVLDGYELIEQDTVFTILFEPRNNTFKGIKGHLKINSFGYAVQYADVEPLATIASMGIKIKQIYERHDSIWFPSELNTSISFANEGAPPIIGSGRTLIKDLELSPDLSETKFSHLKSVKKIQEDIDLDYYRDSLNVKEKNTYANLDSIGKANQFDQRLSLFESLVQGRIPMGKIDMDIYRLINSNEWEGFRLGLGLVTSPKLSKHFELSGYGAYGFRDKDFKYGAGAKVFINKDYQTSFMLNWHHDLWFWGYNPYQLSSGINNVSQFQQFYLNQASTVDTYAGGFETRFARHFQLRLNAEHRQYQASDSAYRFRESLNESVFRLHNGFQVAELSGELRFVFNEKFSRFFGVLLSNGSNAPQLHLKYRMGLKNGFGDFNYHVLDLLAFHNFKFPFSGKSTIYVKAAWQDVSLPLALSNSLDASFDNPSFSVPMSFETMRINEFFADNYVSVGLLYNLVRLYKHEKSAPEIVLVGRAGIGEMNDLSAHSGFDYQVPSNLYTEAGIYLNNLYVQDFFGLGLGGIYRIGNYTLPRVADNISIKLTFNISI